MKNIISLNDYVLNMVNDFPDEWNTRMTRVVRYAKFLNIKLELKYFIPCNDKGEILEEPDKYNFFLNGIHNGETTEWLRQCEEYQKAKDRVLFKGFKLIENTEYEIVLINNKIEYYYNIDYKTFNIRIGGYTDSIDSISDLVGKVQLTDKQHKLLNL